ncbi:uncharacterized protein LOC115547960 [Gadus morhua]|uniref:polynucleotide adenylyltransferase n=1 Tax=Gadus morhua TaxID=8049 RepID=A0A8C5CF00_GADMO|nr:uncharacterized protein LOC115547960 [Gadus morhua]
MDLQADKRFHNLTVEQVQALDQVLTEVLPIYGRGNFPTLEVRAKDMIRGVRERLAERSIVVRDVRLNGASASHVMLRDNGLGRRDLDIVFGVDVPRQEDFQVIKEVVLGVLRDLLPCGVNRRKITWLTMKEAYVQKMVKVFNEHDRWSLIALSNNRSQTVGLRFVSSLRRQFEFSVDSFQIILDRMLESYWESDRKQEGRTEPKEERSAGLDQRVLPQTEAAEPLIAPGQPEAEGRDLTMERGGGDQWESPGDAGSEKDLLEPLAEPVSGPPDIQQMAEPESAGSQGTQKEVMVETIRDDPLGEVVQLDIGGEKVEEEPNQRKPSLVPSSADVMDPLPKQVSRKPPKTEELFKSESLIEATALHPEISLSVDPGVIQVQRKEGAGSKAGPSVLRINNESILQDPSLEGSFPPPAKKTCSSSQGAVPKFCPSPILQRKMSRKTLIKSPPPPPPEEKWSLLTEMTTQLFPPIEIPKTLQPRADGVEDHRSRSPSLPDPQGSGPLVERVAVGQAGPSPEVTVVPQSAEHRHNDPLPSTEPLDSAAAPRGVESAAPPTGLTYQNAPTDVAAPAAGVGSSWAGVGGEPLVTVAAECMYGDFQQAMNHLRGRLIATHSPEEIRGGGLLKYSDLLVRNFRASSEAEIRSLERYMCSRFFIDFPDVAVQQRKIEAYLQRHFVGGGDCEASRYDFLMTLRRVIDESTVCLMGHERRQTLNMITVLALRVLGEQNAIPNTANVTCFYQPAAYMAEPIFSSYYFPQPQPQLVYHHPYPLHVQLPSGLV